jgi:ankyrin repeat protein
MSLQLSIFNFSEHYNKDLVQLLLDYGAEINPPTTNNSRDPDEEDSGEQRRCNMPSQVRPSDAGLIQFLLEHGADVNAEPAR